MPSRKNKAVWIIPAVLILVFGTFFIIRLLSPEDKRTRPQRDNGSVPVEVAVIQHGSLALHRTFSGTIDPQAQFTVAPKVSGRIQRLHVEVADQVTRGQLVAQLEDAEFMHAVAEAEARLAVARANQIEAESRLVIAQRELDRTKTLHERGIASDSVFDSVQAEFLAGQAAVKVAAATVQREEAALAGARIRLGYTRIKADWEQGDDNRTVAERLADEGDTVAANTPLFSIVELDPVTAVIHVTEKDYPRIALGQQARLQSDAFPERVFTGTVTLISPIFSESSRQARVELNVPNGTHLLKPGMFTRCTLELDRVENTASVPEMAITRRKNQTGVFLVNGEGTAVQWIEVQPGLKEGDRVQLVGFDLSGRVVTLGQQLIEDGSAIRIPAETSTREGGVGER